MPLAGVHGLDHLLVLLEEGVTAKAKSEPEFSLLDHQLQCAERLRVLRPDDLELQLAGLVHDVGYVLGSDDEEDHALVGARFIRPLLGDRVASLVALHVAAERYLATLRAERAARLSRGDYRSLMAHGPMTYAEQRSFEGLAEARDAVVLRRADELSVIAAAHTEGLPVWWDRIVGATLELSVP